MSGALAKQYNVPDATDLREAAWLVDWNGKLLKTVMTQSRNTSGMAVGGGFIWMGAEFAAPYDGIYQTTFDGKLVAQRQVPLGPAGDGGGVHGALWHDGKLWLLANRLHAIMRVDVATWTADFLIPLSNLADRYAMPLPGTMARSGPSPATIVKALRKPRPDCTNTTLRPASFWKS